MGPTAAVIRDLAAVGRGGEADLILHCDVIIHNFDTLLMDLTTNIFSRPKYLFLRGEHYLLMSAPKSCRNGQEKINVSTHTREVFH